jgi:hypothetical protein
MSPLASLLETLVAGVGRETKGRRPSQALGLAADAFGLDGVGCLTDQAVADAEARGAAHGEDVAVDENLVAPWVRRVRVAGDLDFDLRVG